MSTAPTRYYGIPGHEILDQRRWEVIASNWWGGSHAADCYLLAGIVLLLAAAGNRPSGVMGLSEFHCCELRAVKFLEDTGWVCVKDGCARLTDPANLKLKAASGQRK